MICRIVPEDSMLTKIGAPEVKNGENNNNNKKKQKEIIELQEKY